MADIEPKTYYLPRLPVDTLRWVLEAPPPEQESVCGYYTISPKAGISLAEAVTRAAIVASCRSQRPYGQESMGEWLRRAARILRHTQDGYTEIAYPASMFGENEGVSKLLAVLTCGGEHDFVDEFWLHEFTLPPSIAARYAGPQFGVGGIRQRLRVATGPIIGVTVRPLWNEPSGMDELSSYRAALVGGADYLADDILFSDGAAGWSIEQRAKRLVGLCKEVEHATRSPKSYIVNLAVDEGQLPAVVQLLSDVGVAAVKINAFFSGFGTMHSLRNCCKMPLIATNIGVSLLTRPAGSSSRKLGTGVSEAVISKLSRICGADGVHLGSIDTGSFVVQPYDPAILTLASPMGPIRPSIAVLGDNVNVGNLWQNLRNFGQNVMIESSSGIMAYPGGAEAGARTFKELAHELAKVDEARLAHQQLVTRATNDSSLKAALEASGYRYEHSTFTE